jgi:hypothetical protein
MTTASRYTVAQSLFADYARQPERYWPPAPDSGDDLQVRKLRGLIQAIAEAAETDPEAAIKRVVSLALKRAPDRPPPIYVMGLGGSGSHWLAEMLAELVDAVYALETYVPASLLEQMRAMPRDEQGFLVDCLHLTHALPLPRNVQLPEEAIIAARAVNSAGGVIHPRIDIWDPKRFVIHMTRDPLDQVSSVTFRKMGFRKYAAPDASDDEYLLKCAEAAVRNHNAWRDSPAHADFVCRYEELRGSPVSTLERLLLALGESIETERIATVARNYDGSLMQRGVVEPRGNIYLDDRSRNEPSVRQRALLHSLLAEARTSAQYPPDECLGQALELEASQGDRELHFPYGGDLGTLFVRDTNGEEPRWRRLADAAGDVLSPSGTVIKLRVRESAPTEAIESLGALPPGSLDSLCLAGNANVDDRLLGAIASGLHGIGELDLARTAVTRDCQRHLASLTSLKGLSLLHTAAASHSTSAAYHGR